MSRPPLLRKLKACMKKGEPVAIHTDLLDGDTVDIGYIVEVNADYTSIRMIDLDTGEYEGTLTVSTASIVSVVEDYSETHEVAIRSSLVAAWHGDDDAEWVTA